MLFPLLVTLLLVFVGFYFQRVHKYKVIDEYPGPSSWEIIKFMVIPKSTIEIYKYLASLNKRYGPVVKIWVKPFQPTLLVADEKFFKHILLSREHVHKPHLFNLLASFLGDGLPVMTDVNLWRQERRILARVFSNQVITNYISTFKNQVSKLSVTIRKRLNEPVDLQHLILRHGLNIIYELLTTEDVSNQDQRVDKFMTALKEFFEVYFNRINSLYKMNDRIFRLTKGFGIWRKSCENAKEFLETTFKRVYEAKKKSGNKSQRQDFLDLLLETGLSYERLLENLRTFIVAGSDTVSASISFALYELSKKPDVQEKIYNEYISILGNDKTIFAEFRDIQQMTYTECVVKEALRMHPTVPMIFRRLITPTDIDGKLFPGGVDIMFSIIASHQMNFENSSEFQPERFLSENSHKLPAHGYAPFSLGPRDCIGRLVAIVEAKFLLGYIVRNFTIHPVHDHDLDLAGEIVLTSKTGVPVVFRERVD